MAVNSAVAIFSTLQGDPKDVRQNVACQLCASVIDGCRAVLSLSGSGLYCAIPKVLRPTMEQSIDLLNLQAEKSYIESILLYSARNERKNVENMLDCVDPDFGYHIAAELDAKLEMISMIESKLSHSKYKRHKIKDKFSKLGTKAEYNIVYADYSSNIHGTLYSLEQSYGGNLDGSIAKLDKYPGDYWVAMYMDVLCVCLLRSLDNTYLLCKHADTELVWEFRKFATDCRDIAIAQLPGAMKQ